MQHVGVEHAAPYELRLDDLQQVLAVHVSLDTEHTSLVAPYVLYAEILFTGTVYVGVRHAEVYLGAYAAVTVSERPHQRVERHAARHLAQEGPERQYPGQYVE